MNANRNQPSLAPDLDQHHRGQQSGMAEHDFLDKVTLHPPISQRQATRRPGPVPPANNPAIH